MNNQLSKILIEITNIGLFWCYELKQQILKKRVNVGDENCNKINNIMWLGLSVFLLGASMIFYPGFSFAVVNDIADMKALSTKVNTEIQNNAIPMVLNAAGISVAAFALITSRWTMLFFGAAYLAFVNIYFGMVNGLFK